MTKIKTVVLFLNRSLVCFDKDGSVYSNQAANEADLPGLEQALLKQIIKDQVTDIQIARFQGASMPITISELCYILGHGEWYQRGDQLNIVWKIKLKRDVENDKV